MTHEAFLNSFTQHQPDPVLGRDVAPEPCAFCDTNAAVKESEPRVINNCLYPPTPGHEQSLFSVCLARHQKHSAPACRACREKNYYTKESLYEERPMCLDCRLSLNLRRPKCNECGSTITELMHRSYERTYQHLRCMICTHYTIGCESCTRRGRRFVCDICYVRYPLLALQQDAEFHDRRSAHIAEAMLEKDPNLVAKILGADRSDAVIREGKRARTETEAITTPSGAVNETK